MARNYAFAPYNPLMRIAPVPARLTTSIAREKQLRNMGVLPVSIQAFEREGTNYPSSLPQIVQREVNLDDELANLAAGGQVTLAELILAKSTAADKFRFFVETSMDETFDLLNIAMLVNGQPFIQQQFFTRAFVDGMEQFFRKMDSESTISIVATLRPGAIPVPPVGTVFTQLFIDAYQGKFLG